MDWTICLRVKLQKSTSELPAELGIWDDPEKTMPGTVTVEFVHAREYSEIPAKDLASAIEMVKEACRADFGKEPDEIYIGDFDAMDAQIQAMEQRGGG